MKENTEVKMIGTILQKLWVLKTNKDKGEDNQDFPGTTIKSEVAS